MRISALQAEGISAPSVAAMSRSRSIGQCSPHRVFTASNVAAASRIRRPIRRRRECACPHAAPRPAPAPRPWRSRTTQAPHGCGACRCRSMPDHPDARRSVRARTAAGGLGGRRHHVVDADGAIYRVQRVPAAPFLMGGPYVQRQIGFRGNRDLHRVQRPGRCRFRGCYMTADGPMRGDAWRTPHLTRCR